jgi:hypothetical protein
MTPQNQQTATPETWDLDDAELLGFGHIETAPGSSTSAEDAVGLALNKRGASGEGPGISSDRRLKTHVQHAGGTPEGLDLYSFRYIGEDREFRGVMAQELLADEGHRGAVEAPARTAFIASTTPGSALQASRPMKCAPPANAPRVEPAPWRTDRGPGLAVRRRRSPIGSRHAAFLR